MRILCCLWLYWVLTNAVTTAAGLATLWAAVHAGASGVIPEGAFALAWIAGLFWGFAGGLVGVGQWLVLRQVLPRAGWWAWATATGWAMSVAVMFLAFRATAGEAEGPSPLDLAIIGAAGGTAVGAVQWLVLRRLVHRAGWWVPASAAGVGAGVLSYSLLTGGGAELPGVLAGGGAGGAAYGIVTGAALCCLLRALLMRGPGVTQGLR